MKFMSPRSEQEGGKSADYWLHKIASNLTPNTEKMFNPTSIHIKHYKNMTKYCFNDVNDHRVTEKENFVVKPPQANLSL